jgi:ubiquitin C-terminal hydrolase
MKKILKLLLFISSISNTVAQPPALTNCGATCYLNAATQALLAISPLTQSLKNSNDLYKQGTFGYTYQAMIKSIQTSRGTSTVNDATFKAYVSQGTKLINANVSSQQDATEYLGAALNALKEEGNLETRSFINSLVEVTEHSTLKCPSQGEADVLINEENVEHFFISLPAENNNHQALATFEQCLKEYTKEEILSDYDIPGCKKQIKLLHAPPFIIFSLKRFRFTLTGQAIKLEHGVSIPFTLDLKPYIKERKETAPYNLIAAIKQMGTAQGGHYIAYVRYGTSWYYCNDSQIAPTEASSIASAIATGYVYIYEQASPGTAIITPLTPPQQQQTAQNKRLISDLTKLRNGLQDMLNFFKKTLPK